MVRFEIFELNYLSGLIGTITAKLELPESHVLVHNWVKPRQLLGTGGFQAWTQELDDDLEVCDCDWDGADLHGMKHYRVKRAA